MPIRLDSFVKVASVSYQLVRSSYTGDTYLNYQWGGEKHRYCIVLTYFTYQYKNTEYQDLLDKWKYYEQEC